MQSFFHTVVPWRPLPPPFYLMFILKHSCFTTLLTKRHVSLMHSTLNIYPEENIVICVLLLTYHVCRLFIFTITYPFLSLLVIQFLFGTSSLQDIDIFQLVKLVLQVRIDRQTRLMSLTENHLLKPNIKQECTP